MKKKSQNGGKDKQSLDVPTHTLPEHVRSIDDSFDFVADDSFDSVEAFVVLLRK